MTDLNETTTVENKGAGMKKQTKLLLVGLGIAAIIGIVITTTVAAADPSNQNNTGNAAAPYSCGTGSGYMMNGAGQWQTVSQLLGLTPAEIQSELQSGKSLVEIAASKGISEEALLNAIITPMKEAMQQMTANGYLTQEQVDQRIELMTQNITQAINTKGFNQGAFCNDGLNGYGMMGGGMMNGGMMGGWFGGNTGGNVGRGGMMGGGMMGTW